MTWEHKSLCTLCSFCQNIHVTHVFVWICDNGLLVLVSDRNKTFWVQSGFDWLRSFSVLANEKTSLEACNKHVEWRVHQINHFSILGVEFIPCYFGICNLIHSYHFIYWVFWVSTCANKRKMALANSVESDYSCKFYASFDL